MANKKKLNWKAEYLEKLKRYSSIFGIPLLVAWKFNGLWMLVDINCFVKAKKNFHLSLEMAMKNNLMSHLAGDFVYVMKPNVGLHILMKKECLISKTESEENSREETWRLRITEVFFTNSEGQKASNLPSGFWPLFITADPEPSDRVEKDFVYQSFVIPENQGMKFAHAALPVLINFAMKNDDKIHWRKQLEEHKYPVEIEQFYAAAQKGLEEGYVKYIFHLEPANIPNFLAV